MYAPNDDIYLIIVNMEYFQHKFTSMTCCLFILVGFQNLSTLYKPTLILTPDHNMNPNVNIPRNKFTFMRKDNLKW